MQNIYLNIHTICLYINNHYIDETEWSDTITLHVETETKADGDLSAGASRGQLVCRFIKSLRGNVIRGLDTGVQHMSLGEHSLIKIRYDHAYASFSMVISSSTLCINIYMHKFLHYLHSGGWSINS